MRIIWIVIITLAMLLTPLCAFPAPLGWMRISFVAGDVQVKTPEADDWGAAAVNGPLKEGDQIWVPQDGRVELQLNSGSYVRLDDNSALQILSLDKDSSQFYLSGGRVYVYDNAPRGNMIQVDTPDASVRAFDKSVFRIDMSDQYTDVAVYKGYVETENQVGQTRVKAGEMVSLAQNTNGEVAPLDQPDEWEKWNKQRNDLIFGRKDSSSRYLPPELRAYSYDFDTGGRWVSVPDYGRCWTPTAFVGPDWAPYRLGRWAWIGGDYVWIPQEPWGWAPYHYGRWTFVPGTGWCWVPPLAGDAYWGPGFVGWVRTDEYVAWVPLAPGEIYYGHGFFGRHSVNITTINITQLQVTHVFRNIHVNNGVVVVSRSTFATGAPRIVRVERNIVRERLFTRNNISIGAPAIRPSREGHFMSTRTIPPTRHPPQHIRNLQVAPLKLSRPLVRNPDESVLNRGVRPERLPLNSVTMPRTPGKSRPVLRQIIPSEQRGRGQGPRTEDRGTGGREQRPAVEPSRVAPQEKQPGTPEIITPRKEVPQVRPQERGPAAPSGPKTRGPMPTPQVTPPGRRPSVPEGPGPQGPSPAVEAPRVAPPERRPISPQVSPPGGEGPRVRDQGSGIGGRGTRDEGRGGGTGPRLTSPPMEVPRVAPPERRPLAPAVPPRKEGPPAEPQMKAPVTPESGESRGERPGGRRREEQPREDGRGTRGEGR